MWSRPSAQFSVDLRGGGAMGRAPCAQTASGPLHARRARGYLSDPGACLPRASSASPCPRRNW
eukprot:923500-Pyramimonas_sp.AAC.1